MEKRLFTSECVTNGHPDKVADSISDAILDACLAQDPNSRVACETMVTTNFCIICGEITTKATVDYAAVAREAIRKIGYVYPGDGFDADTVEDSVPHSYPVRRHCSGNQRRGRRRGRSGHDVRRRLHPDPGTDAPARSPQPRPVQPPDPVRPRDGLASPRRKDAGHGGIRRAGQRGGNRHRGRLHHAQRGFPRSRR